MPSSRASVAACVLTIARDELEDVERTVGRRSHETRGADDDV